MPLARSTLLAALALAPLCFQAPVLAQAQEKPPTSPTLTSLIGQGYEIKAATVTSKIVGIVLQNGKTVYVCVADLLDRPRTTACGKVQ